MASKSSSPGPNPTTTSTVKQTRSRKAAPSNTVNQPVPGRAGSAGGIVLEKAHASKPATKPVTKGTTDRTPKNDAPETSSTPKPRRKPRKLNKEPTPTQTTTASPPIPKNAAATEAAATIELEALKSRVRGLEAKVEQLYNTAEARNGRSPRRRGKPRKNSSATQVPSISTVTPSTRVLDVTDDAEQEEEDEAQAAAELVRLESELQVARQDLEAYVPQQQRRRRRDPVAAAADDDDIEEIPREGVGSEDASTRGAGNGNANRHVTLSGSYRIPLPASVSLDDVRTIQSGVSAAQNVARGFLEQRRAANANAATPLAANAKPPTPRSVSSSLEVDVARDAAGGKQSWSEWIGGYSMAITRAVNKIEHEAAVESAGGRTSSGGNSSGGRAGNTAKKAPGNPAAKKAAGKRPGAKAKGSGEGVQGLMS
ncbi:hypothetical protein IQ07DRAFT_683379 [Pyrenochaeta sp. DS3sAY3a]|nr:hypothetical protein IQ07DRAFT_683379 [Pyrenochaeta sp. DS3sAY3a]